MLQGLFSSPQKEPPAAPIKRKASEEKENFSSNPKVRKQLFKDQGVDMRSKRSKLPPKNTIADSVIADSFKVMGIR